jgi:hypothetical protein
MRSARSSEMYSAVKLPDFQMPDCPSPASRDLALPWLLWRDYRRIVALASQDDSFIGDVEIAGRISSRLGRCNIFVKGSLRRRNGAHVDRQSVWEGSNCCAGHQTLRTLRAA